jgi:hypothetical protein
VLGILSLSCLLNRIAIKKYQVPDSNYTPPEVLLISMSRQKVILTTNQDGAV